jgi:outer membrane receptor protein involved in Fe transport
MSFITSLTKRKPAVFAAFLVVLTLMGGPLPWAAAQSSISGAIGGTISDTSGALLPGTVVTVKSVDTGITRTVKANASGEYLIPDVTPGVYVATFTADGFETYQESAITVTVGSLTSVSPKLKAGSVTDKVEVAAENLQMHTEDNAVSTTIDQNAIDNLPINGRRWSDFARLTPGVVSNSQGFGLLSFRGISFLLNNNTIDGADDNQAYYSEARGRTRTAFSVPPSAIQEFQVNTSNYSAQYGRAAGGVINTVTKSGSNQFHGEVFFYDRDNSLGGAVNPYTLLTVQNAAGTYNSVPTKPKDWRKDWGFTLGGPIIPNKLFFIYTYDQERRNFPAISRPTDPNDVFAPSNTSLPAGETCNTTAFTSTALTLYTEGDYNACEIAALFGTTFQAGSAYYTQGLGILQTFLGYVPRKQDQVINLPKLDYQINDRNRLSLMYNRMRYSSPNGLYAQSTVTEGRSGFGNDNVKEDFGIARLSSVLSNSMVNDALVQYGRDFEFDYQNGPLPNEIPLAQNTYGAAAGTQIGYYTSGGFYAGSNPDLTRYADPDERRLQLLDGLTWSKGKHTAKFGLEYNKVSDYDKNLYNGNGSYSYDYAYTFIADYLNLTTGLGGPVSTAPGCAGGGKCYNQQYYSFSQTFGNPAALITTREYAGYATDDWRITPNLTLTLGVRYEYEYVPPSPFINTGNPALATAAGVSVAATALPQTANRPDDRNNIGPRVGFAWNVYGDGKTILRGGYGMYYGRIINSNILQTYVDSGAPNSQISFSTLHPPYSSAATVGCGPQWPNLEPSAASIYACYAAQNNLLTSSVAYFDPHFQNPQVHEADLALEQNLGRNTTFAVTYMMSLGRELPTAIDTNLNIASSTYATYALAKPAAANVLTSYPISPNSEAASSYSNYPQPPQTGAYVTLPAGGKPVPYYPGGVYKFFLTGGPRKNPAYYQTLDVKSSVNSSYNALAFQVDHRYEHGFSLLTNITWSHGLDENPYESTVIPTYSALDPTNPRADYGNSATDVRLRFVAAVVYQPQTHFHGFEQQALGGWRIAPLLQMQTGLPYSPTISTSSFTTVTDMGGTVDTLAGSGVNGAGSSAGRVPWLDRNSYNYPKTAVLDLRIGKNFYITSIRRFDRLRFEVFAEVFNVANHQNITGVNTEAYTLSDVKNVGTLVPYNNFATYTNSNSNYTYSPRQIQIAARLHF